MNEWLIKVLSRYLVDIDYATLLHLTKLRDIHNRSSISHANLDFTEE